MIQKAIFVVGTGRCGTSWLQEWFLQHPLVFGEHNESRLFEYLGALLRFPQTMQQPELGNRNLRKRNIEAWVDPDVAVKIIGRAAYDLFDQCLMKDNKPYLLEKTPRHIWYVELINKCLEDKCEVYFIHIYRDGRNMLESFMRQDWADSIEVDTITWIQAMTNMLNEDFPKNTIHIKYEDLVHDPSLSRKLTKFCGIEHHGDIKPFESPCGPNSINKFDADRWKTVRHVQITKHFERMKPLLEKLGYTI